jgi:hypothetical protein
MSLYSRPNLESRYSRWRFVEPIGFRIFLGHIAHSHNVLLGFALDLSFHQSLQIAEFSDSEIVVCSENAVASKVSGIVDSKRKVANWSWLIGLTSAKWNACYKGIPFFLILALLFQYIVPLKSNAKTHDESFSVPHKLSSSTHYGESRVRYFASMWEVIN